MRIIYVALACAVVICLYLYAANAYFYHRIHTGNLVFPDIEHSYLISGAGSVKTYAALGDSLTAGVGAEKYSESFPYLVGKELAAKNTINLKVFAYPGLTSRDLVSDYLNSAIKAKPDVVTVLIGTNDVHNWVSAAGFEKNYRTILEKLTKETSAKICVISVPYLGSSSALLPPLQSYFDYKTAQFNDIIKRLAAEYQVTYIDIAKPTKTLFKTDGPQYAADSFHPSAQSYQSWADIIYAGINR